MFATKNTILQDAYFMGYMVTYGPYMEMDKETRKITDPINNY
jgi:hypothetical protein